MPGSQNNIAIMKSKGGNVHASHPQIAEVLHDHWQTAFASKPTDSHLRADWLRDIRDRFKVSACALEPTREDVLFVLSNLSRSAVGPDEVPFEAYAK